MDSEVSKYPYTVVKPNGKTYVYYKNYVKRGNNDDLKSIRNNLKNLNNEQLEEVNNFINQIINNNT